MDSASSLLIARLLTFTVALALLALVQSGQLAPAQAAERGDADCSGAADGHDALAILLTVAGTDATPPAGCPPVGSEEEDVVNGDTNCDGEIDLRDVLQTLQITGGLAVLPCFQVTRATSGEVASIIGPDGGTLNTTGPDGSTFTLEIPPDALLQPVMLRMTPVASVAALPFSGGLAAAVDLQPSGLQFWAPVTLTIAPAQDLAPSAESPFGISHGDFTLADVVPEAGALQIVVTHFSTVGVGSGTPADRQNAGAYSPPDAATQLLNEMAQHLQNSRAAALVGDEETDRAEFQQYVTKLFQYFDVVIAPNLARAASDCQFAATFLPQAFAWARQASLLYGDSEPLESVLRILETGYDALVNCFDEAYERCLEGDRTAIPEMLSYHQTLVILGIGDLVDPSKVEDCATLAFVGSASTTFTTDDGNIVGSASTDDARFEYDEGGDYRTVSGTVHWTYDDTTTGDCTISGSGSFPVEDGEGTIHITDPDPNGNRPYYASGSRPPADPPYTATMTCPDFGPVEINPRFDFIWLFASVMSGHMVAEDGHLRGTDRRDYNSGDIQTWEWDFAPAPQ